MAEPYFAPAGVEESIPIPGRAELSAGWALGPAIYHLDLAAEGWTARRGAWLGRASDTALSLLWSCYGPCPPHLLCSITSLGQLSTPVLSGAWTLFSFCPFHNFPQTRRFSISFKRALGVSKIQTLGFYSVLGCWPLDTLPRVELFLLKQQTNKRTKNNNWLFTNKKSLRTGT